MTYFCESKIRQITTITLTVTILTNLYYDFLRIVKFVKSQHLQGKQPLTVKI